jgi:hypothetical protein
MLTDQEIETLAREALARIVEDARAAPIFHRVGLTENGELVPVYAATSQEGYGSFLCRFMPHAAIKRIISDAERIFDEAVIEMTDKGTGEVRACRISELYDPEFQASIIRLMVDCATLHLISSFGSRLCEMLEDAVTESAIVSNAALGSLVGVRMKAMGVNSFKADAKPDLDKALEAAASKRRTLLLQYLKALPNIIAERPRGAPPKSPEQRQREREAYITRIEEAYRKVRAATGKRPTKTSIATELGEGGINRQTGTDSRLNAFNVKLSRLKINYPELTARIESNLQQ